VEAGAHMKTIAFFFAAFAAFGQTPLATDADQGAPVALIRFQVAPQKGKPVADLRAEDIEVREDGAARKIVALQGGAGNQRDIPMEISLLFDCGRMALSSGTLSPRVFHEGLLDEFPSASIAIYGFSPGLNRLAAPTRDQAALAKALETPLLVHPLSTFLMDHISRVMIDAGSSPGAAVRVVVVVSSGQTDQGSSSATAQQERFERAVAIAQRANIAAYPVVLIAQLSSQDSTPSSAPAARSRTSGPQTTSSDISASTMLRTAGNFANLGASTGGRKLEVLTAGNMLPTVLKQIADEIRSEYVAGFQVSPSGSPKPHKIEVVMRNKDRGRIATGALHLVY
jgi:VWFA-related protein